MLPADGDWLPPEGRIVALFDRRIEGVHVDMDDLSERAVGIGHGGFICPTAGLRV
jgi:hypothetical protein